MITFARVLTVGGLLLSLPLRAVYAPIPEPEQGKDLLVSLKAGVSHDTNLFGASTGAVASTIFTFAPRVTYNRSLTDQTFFSAAYGPTVDYFDNRPGEKLLYSHDGMLRLAHAFTRSTTLDITESLMVSRNPESALAGLGTLPGVTLNPDQSVTRNQIDGRFSTPIGAKSTLMLKARSIYYKYRNDTLGDSLDRTENLYGVSGDYAILPEVKLVGEYRRQDVFYSNAGATKNKTSDYLMAGADYFVAKKLSVNGRIGAEWRRRKAERDTTSPYAELSSKLDYTERSFLVAGYVYMLEETSDISRFTDTQVHRLFANIQHSITPLIVASGSVTYEPSVLQARRGSQDVDEDTVRLGGALSYLPTPRWTVSVSYDYDGVYSELAARDMKRERVGLNASYTF